MPGHFSSIETAIKEIREGRILIIVDDERRENEGDFALPGIKVSPEIINFMTKYGRGLIVAPISQKIASRLDLPPMVYKNEEMTGCNFTISVDARHNITTGISAFDRAKTILTLTNPEAKSHDLVKPGHIFPVIAKDGGVLVRAGHTEAIIDLAKLAGLEEVGVLCEILKEDGNMARLHDLKVIAKKHNVCLITIKDLIEFRRKKEKLIHLAIKAHIPTKYGFFEIRVYKTTIDDYEHVALIMGEIKGKKNVLVRVQSECLTGENFGSLLCDCRAQLDLALKKISKKGEGVFLYMRQEGRGIGLVNKLRAYELQRNHGLDTVEANTKLGFKPDLRHYGIGAQILCDLGLSEISLMTNNPKKIVGIEGYGLKVKKRIPLESKPHKINESYLRAKKDKLGHVLRRV